MQVIKKSILMEFKEEHPDASSQIEAWEAEVELASWERPADVKARYGSASFLENNHVVFNIKGNRYRLLVQIAYGTQVVFVKRAGTHEEYMRWW